jgi:hypothetical protein
LILTHPNIDWKELIHRTGQLLIDIGQKNYLHPKILNAIKNKVRIGVGDKDKMVSIQETTETAKHLPNAEFFVLPGTPHPLNKVNPEWLSNMCHF